MTDYQNNEVIEGLGLTPKPKNLIMVLGVGGAGGNAVNHMYDLGINDVTFMLCNTDRQALASSPVPTKIQLGRGFGAGNDPIVAKNAALESLDDIMIRFENEETKMVFITAGMGGGTGTGAAPVIAKAAHDKGLLTVGIVTLPFKAEGRKRVEQAARGLEELRKNVDSLVVIHNDNIAKIYGSLPLEEAFGKADDVLASAAKGIAELITREGYINVDFADVKAVMKDSGMAVMGSGRIGAGVENKIIKVAQQALDSPLLNHHDIKGAKNILLNLSYSPRSVTFDEAPAALEYIQNRVSRTLGETNQANIIWGYGTDNSLVDEVTLTIVASGFDSMDPLGVKTAEGTTAGHGGKGKGIFDNRPGTIKVGDSKKRYGDIEQYLSMPAYKRRNVMLINAGPSKSSKVLQHEQEPEPQPKPAPEIDLFSK